MLIFSFKVIYKDNFKTNYIVSISLLLGKRKGNLIKLKGD